MPGEADDPQKLKRAQLDEVMLEIRKPPDTTKVKERHLSPELANILQDPCAVVKEIVKDNKL